MMSMESPKNQDHRLSVASDTTYHSFMDIELYEPPSPSDHTTPIASLQKHAEMEHVRVSPPPAAATSKPSTFKMQRQDSGYASYTSTPRTSASYTRESRPVVHRRISSAGVSNHGATTASSNSSTSPRPRTRPSTRRSGQSFSTQQNKPLHLVRPSSSAQVISYTHFPPPEPLNPLSHTTPEQQQQQQRSTTPPPPPPPPALPQTTHYWTSDSTRRLEYAAIDAASRGFKGWVRRNLVPGCLVASEERHVAFDDDSGSVRRYRLELDDEQQQQYGYRPCGDPTGGRWRQTT